MDSDILFLIVVLAFYGLQALVGKKRRQQQQTAPPPRPAAPDAEEDVDFDEALLEIRRALGLGGAPEPSRTSLPPLPDSPATPDTRVSAPRPAAPAPRTSAPSPRTSAPSPRTSAPSPRTSAPSPRTSAPSRREDREFHPVDTGRPDFEDEFERKAPRRAMPDIAQPRVVSPQPRQVTYDEKFARTRPGNPQDDVFAFHDPLAEHDHTSRVTVAAKPEPSHPTAKRLRSREALREAIILKEIVGPPVSRRDRRR